jgi:hypothetical protein
MTVKQGGGKKKRQPKRSSGTNGGGGKTRLSVLEKALIDPKFLDRWGVSRRRRTAEKGAIR